MTQAASSLNARKASARLLFHLAGLLPSLLSAAAAVAVYAVTLMPTVSGCTHPYCADVGEFQVALPLWGTVHYTGYPHYMLLGSPFVTALRLLGISPALGASIYSLVFVAAAVGMLAFVVHRGFGLSAPAAIGVGAAFAFLEPVWVHGVIAEVYGVSLLLCVLTIYLAFRLRQEWSDRRGLLLAFLCGLAVAHHRLLAVQLVPIAIYLLPALPKAKSRLVRWLAMAAVSFVAGFLPYADIPLRVALGTPWAYDRADTWDGFWRIFFGTEVAGLQQPSLAAGDLAGAAKRIAEVLLASFTLPGLIWVGLAWARAIGSPQTRLEAGLVTAVGAGYILFALLFRDAVLLQATLLGTLLALCLAAGIGLSTFSPAVQRVGAAVWLGLAGVFLVTNWEFVTSLTRDTTGVHYISTVEQSDAPAGAVIAAPWGPQYFALAYAQRVEGRMPAWEIVDHRADFRQLAARSSHRIYTHQSTLYVFDPSWWTERLGAPLRISSAGVEMVMLTAASLDKPMTAGFPLGGGVALDRWEVRLLPEMRAHVVLHWVTTRALTVDYSTSVHVSDKEVIQRPEDLLAQSDYQAPVYGWYPTSRWIPNEVIREDHVMQLPPNRVPRYIHVGMYRRNEEGRFVEIGPRIVLRQQDEQWVVNSR